MYRIIFSGLMLIAYVTYGQGHGSIKEDSLLGVLRQASSDSDRVKIYDKLTLVLRFSNPQKAADYGRKGLNLIGDTSIPVNKRKWIILTDNTAIPLAIQGKYEEAMELFFAVLRARESSGNINEISISYTNIGNVYKAMNKLDDALIYYKKALEINRETGDERSISLALNNLGTIYGATGRYEEALEIYREATEIKLRQNDREGLIYAYNNYSVVFERMGLPDSALYYAKLTEKMLRETQQDDNLIANLVNQGRIYTSLGRYEEAEEALLRAVKIAREKNYGQRLQNAYNFLAHTYNEKGDFEKAFYYRDLDCNLRDSLNSVQFQKDVAEISTKYETDKKEQQIYLQGEQLKQEKWVRYSLASGGVLVLLLAGMIWSRYRVKLKSNRSLTAAKAIIEEKNKDITDSIRYAKRIQQAVLPPPALIRTLLGDHALIYFPRDIVSGDFYWLHEENEFIYIAVADCTGHGVPGALVSVVCSNALSSAVREEPLPGPAELLALCRNLLVERFSRGEEDVKDGMDISLLRISRSNGEILWAGANNGLWIIDNQGKLQEIKADKQPVGRFDHMEPFKEHLISAPPGSLLWLFTDGFADQFGGPSGKKLKSSGLKNLLEEIHDQPLREQEKELRSRFEIWKQNIEQVDDVCMLAIRVK